MPTKAAGSATWQVRECLGDGADLVIACGGDGTINEIANGMIGSSVPLGILPAGTANVLAMEIGIGKSMTVAAQRIGSLVAKRISVGRVTQSGAAPRHFVLMMGGGLDARVVADVKPGIKKKLGKLAYWIAGLAQAGRKLEECVVGTPDGTHTASFILISRVRNYGGDLEIAHNVSLLDDDFEVVLFKGTNSLKYMMYFTGVLTGTESKLRGVEVLRAKCLDLTPANGMQVLIQADGELVGPVPARVEIVPQSLTLLLPESYINSR